MSGPKVVRIVTRQEVEAICQRHIAAVGAAADELRRRARRCGMLDGALEAAVSARLAAFAAMLARGQWMDIQKGAPEAVAFLQAEAARLEASATAAAAAARHRGRRAADAARSVAGALEAIGVAVPVRLRAAAQGRAGSPDEAERLVAAGLALIPAARTDPAAGVARDEMARRLGAGETARSIVDLRAGLTPEPTATERRLDALLAELGILDADGSFARRADAVVLEADPSRRALLTDSLVMDAAAHVAALRHREAAAARLLVAAAALGTLQGATAEELRSRLRAAADQGQADAADALVAEAEAMLEAHSKAAVAAARRQAVLAGLASLGYEVRETMASAWERDGRIVVRKPGAADYGVELGAPADAARMQVRLVGSAQPSAPRDARRDADQETIWCSEFDRLRAELASAGGEVVIERALLPGEQPLRSVPMPRDAQSSQAEPARKHMERRTP